MNELICCVFILFTHSVVKSAMVYECLPHRNCSIPIYDYIYWSEREQDSEKSQESLLLKVVDMTYDINIWNYCDINMYSSIGVKKLLELHNVNVSTTTWVAVFQRLKVTDKCMQEGLEHFAYNR